MEDIIIMSDYYKAIRKKYQKTIKCLVGKKRVLTMVLCLL